MADPNPKAYGIQAFAARRKHAERQEAADRATRYNCGMAKEIVVGSHAVSEALRAPGRVHRIIIASDAKAADGPQIAEAARAAGVPVEYVPIAKLNSMTATQDHQGVAATVTPVTFTPLPDFLRNCPTSAAVVLLDRVQHTRNVGMIVRTAAAAGAAGVIVPARGSATIDDAIVRASAGAIFHLPIVRVSNLSQAMRKLRDEGFWIFGLAASEGDSIYDVNWPDRYAIVMGNESDGLRDGVRKNCDGIVHIPMSDETESLNVVVAAGITLFEARRSSPDIS